MCDKIEELFVNFKPKTTVINYISNFEWKKQFQKVYTNSIFKLVQDEIKRK